MTTPRSQKNLKKHWVRNPKVAEGAFSKSKTNSVSFLIEGFSGCATSDEFTEVGAAIQIAHANNCEYFDCIASYNSETIHALLKTKPENIQKAILLSIYLLFSREGSPSAIIK